MEQDGVWYTLKSGDLRMLSYESLASPE